MDEALERELDEAEARGRRLITEAPVAQTAVYDAERGRIVVELSDGRGYAFPPRLCEDLAAADAAALSEIVVDGGGLNLRWPRLDVDLFVPALISGVFGTERWMSREFARHAGRTKSPTKAAASRANGAKGGRPKKAK
jgi:hypothetical protein